MADQPDFIIIGAGKSGTTYMWRALNTHSSINSPIPKELNFFNTAAVNSAEALENYKWKFSLIPDEWKKFEASPGYWTPDTIDRIWELFPDCKLIAMIRHPIEITISAFKHFGAVQNILENKDRLKSCWKTWKANTNAARLSEANNGLNFFPPWIFDLYCSVVVPTSGGSFDEFIKWRRSDDTLAIDSWKHDVIIQKLISRNDPTKYHICIHDNLCNSPQLELSAIQSFVGVTPSVLPVYKSNTSFRRQELVDSDRIITREGLTFLRDYFHESIENLKTVIPNLDWNTNERFERIVAKYVSN